MDEWMKAADAADAFLSERDAGTSVVRDPVDVWFNDEVFVFARDSAPVDDSLLVVDRDTVEARFMAAPPFEPHPFPGLERVESCDEDQWNGPVIVVREYRAD